MTTVAGAVGKFLKRQVTPAPQTAAGIRSTHRERLECTHYISMTADDHLVSGTLVFSISPPVSE